MARNPAAQTAFGPMLLVALEQSEPPDRRLVDDDLAARFLPAPTRWLVTATPPNLMRRLTMAVEPTGRHLTVSPIEWSAYAEKA
jgi:O-methyltransferase involved in polyketide biosynthesis